MNVRNVFVRELWLKKNVTQASKEWPQTIQFPGEKKYNNTLLTDIWAKLCTFILKKMIKMQTVAYSCFLTPDTSWSNSLGMSEFWWGLTNLERVKWKQKSYNHIFKGFVSSDLWNKFIYKEIRRIIARLSFCRCLQHKIHPAFKLNPNHHWVTILQEPDI